MRGSEIVGVIGAGAWGTALAQMLARDGTPVRLWAREPALADAINTARRNAIYLPSADLARSIRATSDLADFAGVSTVLVVTPAQFLGPVLRALPPLSGRDLVLCAKGIEAESGRMMAEVAAAAVPDGRVAVLSGPTFAHEVAAGLPTAVTLACSGGDEQWRRISPLIARPNFRPYYTDDVIGAEIGGAVKNVLAIACGVVDGLRLGQNARAALISRGFAEMGRLATAFGARAETLAGLSGLGDLVLTCSSTASRNYSLGLALGEGAAPAALLENRTTVAEGAHTAPVLVRVAAERDVAMPIAESVCALLSGEIPAREAVSALLSRPLKPERDAVA